MAVETPSYVSCPKCKQTLPAGATRCQFCGQGLAPGGPASGRGVVIISDRQRKRQGLTWKEWGYIVCSSLIILSGIVYVLASFGIIAPELGPMGLQTYLGCVGTIRIFMGAALLAQQIWAQFLMKWLCVIGALNGAWGIIMGLAFSTPRHPYTVLNFAFGAFELVVLCFTVYFIVDMADV